MRLGVFLENFTATELTKDPGLITLGLIEEGIDVKVFSHHAATEVSRIFSTSILSEAQRNEPNYWKESEIDSLIIYSWLSLRYSKMISAAKEAGVRVILKLDSDGYLIYPLKPSYLKVFGLNKGIASKMVHLVRMAQWTLFPRIISRIKIKQIQTSDAVIIETPVAADNLKKSLLFWKREDLIDKIKIIPNPVSNWPKDITTKQNIITAIGRWDDTRKNATALVRTLSGLKCDWQIHLIGNGSEKLAAQILEKNPRTNIRSSEKKPHTEVFQDLAETKILFAPSVAESYNLAVAESLCCGCSFVGGPLTSFQYFSNNGFSGRLTSDLKTESFIEALYDEINKWNSEDYDPAIIASYWQKELSPSRISRIIIDIMASL
ncbi:MAG: glycosyltransferase [bacterium]|nr:glycosyltransferase [bacterium]